MPNQSGAPAPARIRMSRLVRLSPLLAVAAGVVIAVGRGAGQELTSPRVVLQMVAPDAIDRGLAPDQPPDPNTPVTWGRTVTASRGPATRVGASGAAYVPGKLIVKFRPTSSASSRLSTVTAVSRSAALQDRPPSANFDVLTIDPADDAEAMAQAFAERPDVEYAQAAYRIHPYLVPNDPLYLQYQWNFPAIDMERAWDIQPGATRSVIVAVLDSGLAYQNAILRFNNVPGFSVGGVAYPPLGTIEVPFAAANELGPASRFVAPRDFIWNDTLPVDTDGHGTHVAGTIGQLTNDGIGTAGIAFNVRLMPVKVIDSLWDDIFGAPNLASDDIVARGIRYAADNGAKVLNMSIGRTGPPAPAVEDAIKYAVSKGCFVAIAGGNQFESGNPTEVLAEIASRVQGAVSVGATDRAHNRAFYSSSANWVELTAPGGSSRGFGGAGVVYQQTYDPSLALTFLPPPAQYGSPRFDAFVYFGLQGTSMATPHVAGVAALLAQQGITDPAAIEAALERFATDRGPAGRDNDFGYGEINARNTLRGLGLAR